MIAFNINKQKVNCPITWEEVTVAQYLKLKKAANLSDIFKALTRFDLDISEEQLEVNIFPFLTFISDPPDFDNLPVPELIVTIGKPPMNLGHESFGKKIAAQKIISKAFKGKDKIDVTYFMIELLQVYLPKDTIVYLPNDATEYNIEYNIEQLP